MKPLIRNAMLAFAAAGAVAFAPAFLAPAAAQDHSTKGIPPLAAPPVGPQTHEAFLKAADEVLAEMSEILHLPPKGQLKKSIRTREEIRQQVLKDMTDEKEKDERQADELLSKKLGLIPEELAWEPFLVDLLTEQVAGLYEPKTHEFYIADWIEPADQREVMAHELTHALQDEHFSIEKWADAAKPNDDAEFARHAVLEGSAFAAMVDWQGRDRGVGVRDLPDLSTLLSPELMSGGDKSPKFDSAPQFVRDMMLFPYLSGAVFTQKLLQQYGGWPGFYRVFDHPPASTQQILHPDLYFRGVAPAAVTLPALPASVAPKWRKLEETVGGEFLLLEWMKEFTGSARAKDLASLWTGDLYAIYAEAKPAPAMKPATDGQPASAGNPRSLLVWRITMANEADAARVFGGASEALQLRYDKRTALLRRPNYFEFQTPQGGVFLRCIGRECLLVDGTDRAAYDELTKAMGWPAAPTIPPKPGDQDVARVVRPPHPGISAPPM
ncbi:MAG TPA: hypothetical protein VKG84_05505 [Candidatus Acidoferrales bacterium]|nr:hypothetical protein [Candidatus Acidoferrales bacterium]